MIYMKITSQLSLATLAIVGVLATGCSQQQVNGGGASQVQEAPAPAPEPTPAPTTRRADPNAHTHPANKCTNSITHTHPNGARTHNHRYSCKGNTRRSGGHRGGNKWSHVHPAIPNCTDSITHTHKYQNRNHSHKYGCRGGNRGRTVDVHALQRKLKAKGYYKGPINGVVGPETRSALQRYMQNR
jgi:hypothetical protein